MTESKSVGLASLNFVDMRKNTGPGVNESDFNLWLLKTFGDSVVYSPFDSDRLGKERGNRVRAFGPHSLRTPLRMISTQFSLVSALARDLRPGAILYYRHSRLTFAAAILKRRRPDVVIAMTRTHPAGSDKMINISPLNRLIARIIAGLDDRLRIAIARKAHWVDCVTQEQALLLQEETGRRVDVVMNGVNTSMFKPHSETHRAKIRANLGIPEQAIVVGYCGGFPEQRGAREISALTAIAPDTFGIVIGKLFEADRAELAHDRIRLLGEIDYQDVPDLVGAFDVAVALDVPGRSGIAGNSNQKVRQGLASGAWILTQAADLPFEDKPYLGLNAVSRDEKYLAETIRKAQQYFPMRKDRATYARENLSTDTIFHLRHEAILSGAKS